MVREGDMSVLAQFETFTPSYTSRKNDAENNVATLEVAVVGKSTCTVQLHYCFIWCNEYDLVYLRVN